MSISDFESKKQFPLKFLQKNLKEDEHVLYINKNSHIRDLVAEFRSKLAQTLPEKQNSRLRVLEV